MITNDPSTSKRTQQMYTMVCSKFILQITPLPAELSCASKIAGYNKTLYSDSQPFLHYAIKIMKNLIQPCSDYFREDKAVNISMESIKFLLLKDFDRGQRCSC